MLCLGLENGIRAATPVEKKGKKRAHIVVFPLIVLLWCAADAGCACEADRHTRGRASV